MIARQKKGLSENGGIDPHIMSIKQWGIWIWWEMIKLGVYSIYGTLFFWSPKDFASWKACPDLKRVVTTLRLWPMDERLVGIPLSAEVILIATWTAARSYIYILYKCHRICFFCVEHFCNVFDDQQYEPLDDVRWNHVLPVRLFGGGQIKILCLASRIELPEHSYNRVFLPLAATLRKVTLLESTESWWKLCSREGPETLYLPFNKFLPGFSIKNL